MKYVVCAKKCTQGNKKDCTRKIYNSFTNTTNLSFTSRLTMTTDIITLCSGVHLDSCVTSVVTKFMNRAEMGMKKYGTDLDRDDLTIFEWINHAQDEHMDAILYLEKLKHQLPTAILQQTKHQNKEIKQENNQNPTTLS